MPKVLLVDDHPDILRLLQISLRSDPLEILTASNGREALELVERERPDLMILDVVMPEVDGLRVLNRVKTHTEWKSTIVVMLTVKDHPEEITLGLDVGADFYLSKPFRPGEVASLVRRLLLQALPAPETGSADGEPAA